ncbi:uncharacterized protein V1516DRAFT_679131 [Lipomyces oligophaga]|uniref:uncharacterized protein n=1 Tax=Lipomyces oligophaga TaxID=45792 RepID=UPI0034CFCC3D
MVIKVTIRPLFARVLPSRTNFSRQLSQSTVNFQDMPSVITASGERHTLPKVDTAFKTRAFTIADAMSGKITRAQSSAGSKLWNKMSWRGGHRKLVRRQKANEVIYQPNEEEIMKQSLQKYSFNAVTLANLPNLGPYAGRSVRVRRNLNQALGQLIRITRVNEVAGLEFRYREFERPNLKRKRIARELRVKRFNKSIKQMFRLYSRYRSLGY